MPSSRAKVGWVRERGGRHPFSRTADSPRRRGTPSRPSFGGSSVFELRGCIAAPRIGSFSARGTKNRCCAGRRRSTRGDRRVSTWRTRRTRAQSTSKTAPHRACETIAAETVADTQARALPRSTRGHLHADPPPHPRRRRRRLRPRAPGSRRFRGGSRERVCPRRSEPTLPGEDARLPAASLGRRSADVSRPAFRSARMTLPSLISMSRKRGSVRRQAQVLGSSGVESRDDRLPRRARAPRAEAPVTNDARLSSSTSASRAAIHGSKPSSACRVSRRAATAARATTASAPSSRTVGTRIVALSR